MHYGEVKCCSNFRPGVGVMLGVNAAHFTAMDVGVTLPKMFCWYLARTFTQLCDGDFVSFWRTTTLLLLVVGALQHYFYLLAPHLQPGHGGPMLRRSPAKVGLPRARLWTGDHITPGDLVCPTKSIPSFHRQERRELPPTRGLAGSGSRLRRLQKSTNGPRSPVPWSLTEWALPPPGAPTPRLRRCVWSRRAGGTQPRAKQHSGVADASS